MIQVGVANNYKAQADATIDEKIGTVKTYTFLIGQKYKNTDADIDIKTMKEFEDIEQL